MKRSVLLEVLYDLGSSWKSIVACYCLEQRDSSNRIVLCISMPFPKSGFPQFPSNWEPHSPPLATVKLATLEIDRLQWHSQHLRGVE